MTRVAIVHECFSTYAGSEKVVEQMLQALPEAELFALANFMKSNPPAFMNGREVTTTFLERLPFAKRAYRSYLPLMPMAIEQLDVLEADLVVSSQHCVSHGVLCRPDQVHISYVHSPVRYAWDLQFEYLRQANLHWGLKSMLARMILHYIRIWDRAAADRVDLFVANSRFIASRIRRCYRREAEVIYPPVAVKDFELQEQKEDFYLVASRMVPYKRMGDVVEAF
ncbi:MAG: glycosyltransferase, partial [Planctomycetaceae bacterium]|nr:glycosyltransferase [Planctomycetaceae bacterium]